jgi:hypothetical protein
LITELLLLPLAPVRGTAWITAQIAAEAERMVAEQRDPRRLLQDLTEARARGEITEVEFNAAEEELLAAITAPMTFRFGEPLERSEEPTQ